MSSNDDLNPKQAYFQTLDKEDSSHEDYGISGIPQLNQKKESQELEKTESESEVKIASYQELIRRTQSIKQVGFDGQ